MKMEINPEIELNIHNKINDENLISDNFALNFYNENDLVIRRDIPNNWNKKLKNNEFIINDNFKSNLLLKKKNNNEEKNNFESVNVNYSLYNQINYNLKNNLIPISLKNLNNDKNNIISRSIYTIRFRNPRISLRNHFLKNYNYEEAEIGLLLINLFSNMKLNNYRNIIFNKKLMLFDENLVEVEAIIIISQTNFLVLINSKIIFLEFLIKDFVNIEISNIENNTKYLMKINLDKIYFLLKSKDYNTFCEIYSIMENISN